MAGLFEVEHDPFVPSAGIAPGAVGDVASAFGIGRRQLTPDQVIRGGRGAPAYVPQPPSLKPYEPTWRDRLGAAMIGDRRASPEVAGFVEGLVGSRGLGNTGGISVADVTPLGGVFGAQESLRGGDTQGAAMAMLPMGGVAKNTLKAGESIVETTLPKITAYHGTPHDFDRFDLGKIGTGEGAQVYGHGLYFAEHPDTAVKYRDSLSDLKDFPLSDKSGGLPSWLAKSVNRHEPGSAPYNAALDEGLRDFEGRLAQTKAAIADPNTIQPWLEESKAAGLQKTVDDLKRLRAGEVTLQTPGHLYQVEIDAHPDHFLDWDKPLSGQSPEVQKALSPIIDMLHNRQLEYTIRRNAKDGIVNPSMNELEQWSDMSRHAAMSHTGWDLMDVLTKETGKPSLASQKLKTLGVPGIKYLDQGSRAAGEGTNNYVLFDDKHVSITHKNGVRVTPVDHDPFAE